MLKGRAVSKVGMMATTQKSPWLGAQSLRGGEIMIEAGIKKCKILYALPD